MILGTTAKEQIRRLRKPERWFAWRRVRLIDTRSAWFCYVWRWYPDAYYIEGEREVRPGRPSYSRELPSRRKLKSTIPTLRNSTYEIFSKGAK